MLLSALSRERKQVSSNDDGQARREKARETFRRKIHTFYCPQSTGVKQFNQLGQIKVNYSHRENVSVKQI